MAGGDGGHVCGAMAKNMRDGFAFITMATGWVRIRPALLDSICWQAVEADSVDKVPVFKANVEASVEPGTAVGEAVGGKRAWGFALVAEKFGSSRVSCDVM